MEVESVYDNLEIWFENEADYDSKIAGILNEFNNNLSTLVFRFRNELKDESITFKNMPISPKIIYASECENIDGSYIATYTKEITHISPDLFKGMPNLKSAMHVFAGASNIKSDIPSNLFSNNNKITSFYGLFDGNPSITTIPNELFSSNVEAVNFSFCFRACPIENIPEDLFKHNANAHIFDRTFSGCKNITEIPSNLFKSLGKTNLNYFFGECFEYSGIVSIPEDLFDSFTEINSLAGCFIRCESLKYIPEFWNKSFSVTGTRECFYGCINASNYYHVPIDWGGPTKFDDENIQIEQIPDMAEWIGDDISYDIKIIFNTENVNCVLKENILDLNDIEFYFYKNECVEIVNDRIYSTWEDTSSTTGILIISGFTFKITDSTDADVSVSWRRSSMRFRIHAYQNIVDPDPDVKPSPKP